MSNILNSIKRAALFAIRKLQRVLMTLLLFLTYTILLGAMLVLVSLFGRRLLWQPRKRDSYWVKAEGYEPDLQESARQS